jgi:hypothetical protein
MHRLARTVSILVVLGLTRVQPGDSQTLSLAAASGPVLLPGSGASADWQGLIWLGYQMGQPWRAPRGDVYRCARRGSAGADQ